MFEFLGNLPYCDMRSVNIVSAGTLFAANSIAVKNFRLFHWDLLLPFNSFPASGDLCRLLITFANSLDQDQARQNVGPDLDLNCLTF